MKLATKVYVVTLIILTLVFAVSAQKSEKEPRNTAPTVGTGGPMGGPTGLFTVYDSSTLRKGEYTFGFALSNYDRDPGNVDISSLPASFQVGLTNRLELFFTTEAWRGIKVNAPQNLSSFYLPNSQLSVNGVLGSRGAIVLGPQGSTAGPLSNIGIFRPAGTAFGQFPFVGTNLGTFGVNAPFCAGPFFGFATVNNVCTPVTINTPRASAGGGADLFPGMGSVYGSILPGIVLTTQNLTQVVNGVTLPRGTAPLSFTNVPTYVADAPFINRTWGTSSFNTLNAGFKWRFNDTKDAWGHGITAFYRYYMDKADDFSGFNMMQRGSGVGSEWGDIGVTYFIDARATKWANVSFNAGYVWTSKVKGTFGGGEYTMFDPGDELQLAVGVDFPVNKYFQPILEFRSLDYVGGRTPNALEQNPKDGIAGFRVYPRRWFGFGFAYRHNFNQQDIDSFDDMRTTSTAFVCGPLNATNCVPVTGAAVSTGLPAGLGPSSDPHGYIANFWIGRRDKRAGEVVNQPANVDSVTLSDTEITLPCPPGRTSRSGACSDSKTISVATRASDPENDVLTYNYTVSGGRIVGTGANVQWDLSSAQAGTYTIVTGVDDGCGVCGRTDTKTITIRECPDCEAPPPTCPDCSSVSVSGPAGVTTAGDTMTFTATASGANSYNWTVTAGTIESGQGTPSITVRTTKEMAGSNVTATVNVGFSGRPANCGPCPGEASDTASIAPPVTPTLTDEYGALKDDDVKARIDNFYIQLNNNPSARGYIIIYGTPAQIRRQRAQINKAIAFRKYDASRITFVDGPDNGEQKVKLWIVPPGADNPQP